MRQYKASGGNGIVMSDIRIETWGLGRRYRLEIEVGKGSACGGVDICSYGAPGSAKII